MGTLLQDLRFGARMLRKNPGFTAVAIISLGLGVCLSTTIYSVINGTQNRPLPFSEPDRLVMINEKNSLKGSGSRDLMVKTFEELQEQSQSFDALALTGIGAGPVTFSGTGAATQVRQASLGRNILSVLGVQPILGRNYALDDDLVGGGNVVIISYEMWQRRFGGEEGIIGRQVRVDGKDQTIIGVMPPGFWLTPYSRDAEVLMGFQTGNTLRWLSTVGRLKPGVSIEQAQAETATIVSRSNASESQDQEGWTAHVEPLREAYFGPWEKTLYTLLAIVSLVLLIACANVANMLLARGAARRTELTIRAALGAVRGRLIRQLLAESVLLSLMGGVLGVILTFWGIRLFVALIPYEILRVEEIGIDVQVMGFALLLSVFTGILFGLWPAWRASKLDLNEALKGGRSSQGALRRRQGNALLIAEVALAMILLMNVGLLVRNILRQMNVDLGYSTENLLTADILLSGPDFWKPMGGDVKRVTPKGARLYQQILEEVESQPGVDSVGMISHPLGMGWGRPFTISGRSVPNPGEEPNAGFNEISPSVFQMLKLPLLKGRYLTERDTEETPWVIVIDETMARQFFPDEDPIGKTIQVMSRRGKQTLKEERLRQIVGVVGNVRSPFTGDQPRAIMYGSYRQHPADYPGGFNYFHLRKTLLIRTSISNPMGLASTLKKVVEKIDRHQPVYNIKTMEQYLSDMLSGSRFMIRLFGLFGGFAILLSAVGIYGVMSYFVTRRTHEFGLRMALGAGRGDVLKLVLWQALKPTLIGIAISAVGIFALSKLFSSFIVNFKMADPWTLIAVSALMIGVAMLACYIPARRATKVDPMVALRYE